MVVTETSSFTYQSTQTTGFSVGTTYLYKYRAKNQYGWGDFSPVLSMMAGEEPDQLATVVTSLSAKKLAIDWSTTANDHSLPVTEYEIKIQNDDATSTYTADA